MFTDAPFASETKCLLVERGEATLRREKQL